MRGLLTASLVVFAASTTAAQLPSTGELLDRYARGDFAALTLPKSANDLGRFRQALEHDAERWLREGSRQSARKRQLVAATIALEVARASLDLDWGEGRRLIAWASAALGRGAPDEPERLWHLAALSVIHGAYDNALLLEQQKAAWSRFPSEPRFVLGVVIMIENDTWPDPDRGEPWDDNDAALADSHRMLQARRDAKLSALSDLRAKAYEHERRTRMRTAITLLEDLSNEEGTRAEVLLRLGFLHLRLHHPEIALEQFEEVVTLGDEPFVAYLGHLLMGMAKEQAGDRANAIAAYRTALEILPRAQSASVALASLLFLDNRRDEAARLLDDATQAPLAADPWRTYQTGDWRHWNDRISAVRKALP